MVQLLELDQRDGAHVAIIENAGCIIHDDQRLYAIRAELVD